MRGRSPCPQKQGGRKWQAERMMCNSERKQERGGLTTPTHCGTENVPGFTPSDLSPGLSPGRLTSDPMVTGLPDLAQLVQDLNPAAPRDCPHAPLPRGLGPSFLGFVALLHS